MVKRATESSMYCRQCQETYGNSACTIAGVCGKRAITAGLMDELVARLEDFALEKKPTRELENGEIVGGFAHDQVLALISLGFQNISIGPTFPAFISPCVLQMLIDRLGLFPKP